MENKADPNQSASWSATRAFLIGFAIFDIIHLVCAIVLIVFAYAEKPIADMEAAECFVEIVFSILLMCFINAMQHHHKSVDHPRVTYTLGYLTASASLFVPLSFSLPEIIEGDWTGSYSVALSLVLACIVIAFLCFFCFFLALLSSRRPKVWGLCVLLGLCMMICLVPVEIASEFYTKESTVTFIFHVIKAFAPLSFAPLGIILVAKRNARHNFFRELN